MRLRSFLYPALVVGMTYLALLGIFSAGYGYRAMDFVHLGTVWGEHDPNGTWGYDGQFYYQIARDPFAAAQFMDNAPYRYQRIVYPLLARLLSLGQSSLIPYALLFINWVSIVLSVAVVAKILQAHGLSPCLSLGYGLYFGQATALTFDTAEPFTSLLICLGIWLSDSKHVNWAATLFGLASLSRETAVLFPAAYIIFFLRRAAWKEAIRWTALSILPLTIWLVILNLWFGATGVTFAPPFENIPFYGILSQAQAPRKFWLLVLVMFIPTMGAGCISVWGQVFRAGFFRAMARHEMVKIPSPSLYF